MAEELGTCDVYRYGPSAHCGGHIKYVTCVNWRPVSGSKESTEPTATKQSHLYVVERDDGEWISATDDVGYSCFTSLTEARDLLELVADDPNEQKDHYKIVHFVRREETLVLGES
jgi:hypothetical protein